MSISPKGVDQDARQVRTKFTKSFPTFFFPVGDDICEIVAEWIAFLRTERFWGSDDPLLPATRVVSGDGLQFQAAGLERRCWSNAAPIRTIFREAFTAAGLPYFNPHSFRRTLARLGQERCSTPEAFKALSQNLGHDDVLTTFASYGQVDTRRQAAIIRDMAKLGSDGNDDPAELAARLV